MSRLDDNFAYNIVKVNNAPKLESLQSNLGSYIKSGFLFLVRDIIFFYTILVLLAKSIFFIGLVNNDNATSFSRLKAFHSFDYPPPIGIYIAFIVIFLCFAYLFRRRMHFWFLVICNILFSLLLVADLMYYRGFGSFLSLHLLSQSSNLENLLSSIVSMLRPVDFVFVADFVLMFLVGIKLKKIYAKTSRNLFVFLILVIISVTYIYYQHYKLDIKGNGSDSMLFRVSWVPNQTITNLSPLGYHLYDIYNYYEDSKPYKLTPQEKEEIKKWFAQKNENLPPNEFQGIYAGQNLILIQVESLENFVINQKINGQEITPNLNRLLAHSFYFSNFYEQVYNGNSSDADLLANTSVYPVRRGSTFFRFPDNTYNSLPKLLREKGYKTLAIHPDKGAYWNWMRALSSIGFEKEIDATYFNQDEKIGLGISDGSYLKQVAPIINKEKQPFYTFLVTLTSHSPFDLPKEYRELALDEQLDKTKLGGYFQSIRYTDKYIGAFLDTLDKNGLLENTVVVIYGDHTGVHKYYNDEVKQIEPRENWWLDDSKRIPLIIYHKGLQGQEIKTTGGQIDILPTVAYLMGIDNDRYKNTAMGRNLLNTKKDFAVLANGQYVGKAANKEEQENFIKGIDLADLIIRSNYFKLEGFK